MRRSAKAAVALLIAALLVLSLSSCVLQAKAGSDILGSHGDTETPDGPGGGGSTDDPNSKTESEAPTFGGGEDGKSGPQGDPSDSPAGGIAPPPTPPTDAPTEAPTESPSDEPSISPTEDPTDTATDAPSETPTDTPTESPTESPTDNTTDAPSDAPTDKPTDAPTDAPSDTPSESPTGETDPSDGPGGDGDGSVKDKLFVPLVIVVLLLAAAVAWLLYERFGPKTSTGKQEGYMPQNFAGSSGSSQAQVVFSIGNLHNIGKRDEQQDSFCVSDIRDARATSEKGLLAVVADGMGGLQGGAAISQLVSDTFLGNYKAMSVSDPDAFLYDCTLKAQSAVRDYMSASGVKGGSTLVAVLVKDGLLHFLSVGDSRIYLLRGGMLGRLNHPHNYGALLKEQASRGEVDPEEPFVNPRKDALTSYIGIENLRMIDRSAKPMELRPGDKLMLCSDGVFNTLSDDILTGLMAAPAPEAAPAIEEAVLAQNRRHQDNFTAILIDIGGAGE